MWEPSRIASASEAPFCPLHKIRIWDREGLSVAVDLHLVHRVDVIDNVTFTSALFVIKCMDMKLRNTRDCPDYGTSSESLDQSFEKADLLCHL